MYKYTKEVIYTPTFGYRYGGQTIERLNGKSYTEWPKDSFEYKNFRTLCYENISNIGEDGKVHMTGISKFESYLLNLGYVPYYYDNGNLKQYKKPEFQYSSMQINILVYKKGRRLIYYGLHEKGHHPGLIRRPKIKVKRFTKDTIFKNSETKDTDTIWLNESFDSSNEVMFEKESIEDIYNAIFNNKKVFIYDLTIN